jgi:hypothetical protein
LAPALVGVIAVLVHFSTHKAEAHTAQPTAVVAARPLPASPAVMIQSETQGSLHPEDVLAFASLADSDVSQLHEGITLAQWMDEHKDEDWQTSADEAFFDCRTLTKAESLPSGKQATRTVYFYPPKAPTPVMYPALSGQELINHDCTLAMVRVQTPTQTKEDGVAFEQSAAQKLSEKYGKSIGMKDTPYSRFSDAGHWIAGPLEIVSVYDPTHAADLPDDEGADTVHVSVRLPIVREIEQDSCCRFKEYRYRSIENTQFHRALAIAGVEPPLTDRIAQLYEGIFRDTASLEVAEESDLEKSRAAVLPALREWLARTRASTPLRRAAGLYVADRLLASANDLGWEVLGDKDKPELRSAFEAIGARFRYMSLDGAYSYEGNWLDEARALDPEGTVGRMAVLISLARGEAPRLNGNGNENNETFRTVITDGEWLLAKNPDAATAAQIHFIIGDAYSDIVALAGGAEPDYGEPAKYQPEAGVARQKALEQYRAGLAVDDTSDNAKDAWLQAWHLSARLLPTTRYVYIYD